MPSTVMFAYKEIAASPFFERTFVRTTPTNSAPVALVYKFGDFTDIRAPITDPPPPVKAEVWSADKDS